MFYEYLRLLKTIKPKYFLLENVKMNKEEEEIISNHLGVSGIHINSNLVSYQNRPRIYWTNIPGVIPPIDKHISFQDYKETENEVCKEYIVPKTSSRIKMWNNGEGKNGIYTAENVTYKDKINTVTRKQDRTPNSGLVEYKDWCRFLTRHELEQAQTLPIDYTKILTYNQMQDVVGDGWTVDVIAHILSFIPEFKA